MLLAIDTSTRFAGVLLWKDGLPLFSQSWRSVQNHTSLLMPAIQHTLQHSGIQAKDLHAVAVALGPGGFSALRVGMSAAKGLCLPFGVPLIGITTLEAEALPYADAGLPVCPLLNIGRREMAWACYQKLLGKWQKTHPEEVIYTDQLPHVLTPGALLCGEGLLTSGPLLREAIGHSATVMEYPGPAPRLWALAQLAAQRLERGLVDDPFSLQPLYLRRPSITPPNPPRKVKP